LNSLSLSHLLLARVADVCSLPFLSVLQTRTEDYKTRSQARQLELEALRAADAEFRAEVEAKLTTILVPSRTKKEKKEKENKKENEEGERRKNEMPRRRSKTRSQSS
jgi:hypothetical protein